MLELPEIVHRWMGNLLHFLIILTIAWLISRLLDAFYREYLVPVAAKTETDLDDQLLPIVRKGTKMIVWVIGVIVALNNAGYDVGALIAGLGIGALALAMAAKDTVSNIFGVVLPFLRIDPSRLTFASKLPDTTASFGRLA